MDEPNRLDAFAAQPHTREKVVATANRCECVYKRTGEPSVTFHKKGGARKRADVFLDKEKRSKAFLCSDAEDANDSVALYVFYIFQTFYHHTLYTIQIT